MSLLTKSGVFVCAYSNSKVLEKCLVWVNCITYTGIVPFFVYLPFQKHR